MLAASNSLEIKIKQEYGVVSSWIALHPYLATLFALIAGCVVGHLV